MNFVEKVAHDVIQIKGIIIININNIVNNRIIIRIIIIISIIFFLLVS